MAPVWLVFAQIAPRFEESELIRINIEPVFMAQWGIVMVMFGVVGRSLRERHWYVGLPPGLIVKRIAAIAVVVSEPCWRPPSPAAADLDDELSKVAAEMAALRSQVSDVRSERSDLANQILDTGDRLEALADRTRSSRGPPGRDRHARSPSPRPAWTTSPPA